MTNEQILIEIQVRQKKIDHLQMLYNMPVRNVEIWYMTDKSISNLDQSLFPFNLASEVKTLLLESIVFYENEIQEFKNKL